MNDKNVNDQTWTHAAAIGKKEFEKIKDAKRKRINRS